MSFRIEEKLYIRSEHILDFKKFLTKSSAKQLYKPRAIKSLYFDNLNFDMYNDSIEGTVPRKKIRIREYPNSDDKNYYLEIKHSSVEGRFKTNKLIMDIDPDQITKIRLFDTCQQWFFGKHYCRKQYSYILGQCIS